MKRPFLLYASLAVVSFALLGEAGRLLAKDESYKYLSNFSETLDLVQKNYVEDVGLPRLMDGAFRGLLDELDPDSFYLDAKLLKRYREAPGVKGRVDIGADLSKRHGYAIVVSTVPGGPAAADLASGDYIRVIDGASTREMSLFEIRERLLGAPGSEVKLKVVRRESLENKEITLKRTPADAPALVRKELPDGVVSLRLRRIDDATLSELAQDVRHHPSPTALVLDLRGCSLGTLADGARLADLFLDSGTVLRVHGKIGEPLVKRALAPLTAVRSAYIPVAVVSPSPNPSSAAAASASPAGPRGSPPDDATATPPSAPATPSGYEFSVQSRPDDTVWRGPLVVLADRGTAGAAEIAIAALKDAGRADLVGSRSFGRGSIQDLILLEDGAALQLTIATAVTPKGVALMGKGIEPDEVVAGTLPAPPGTDPALDKALERLKQDGRPKKAV